MISTLRITFRTLAKTPAFSLTAIAALALGIGSNTAIFSVVNQVLLNPAGASNPDRMAALRVKYDKLALRSISVSVPDFSDVQKSTQLIEAAALIGPGDFNYTGSGMPERLQGAAAPLVELCDGTETLARAALLAAGYRRHDQGQWRKKRGSQAEG